MRLPETLLLLSPLISALGVFGLFEGYERLIEGHPGGQTLLRVAVLSVLVALIYILGSVFLANLSYKLLLGNCALYGAPDSLGLFLKYYRQPPVAKFGVQPPAP